MQGLGRIEKDRRSPGRSKSRRGFMANDPRFSYPGNNNLSITFKDQLGGLSNATLCCGTKAPQGFLHGIDQLVERLNLHWINLLLSLYHDSFRILARPSLPVPPAAPIRPWR